MNKTAAAIARPRLEARREAFVEAATAAFLEKGYANTTLDDIIARSGGSRQTLYALFGGKKGLFEALMTERCSQIFSAWEKESDLLDRPPEHVLVEVGIRYLEAVTAPDALGVFRLVVAECMAMKELAEQFWETGPGRSRAVLADYFEQQVRRGTLLLADPERAAHQFWGMLLGNLHMQCLLGLRPAPDRAEIEGHVRTAVARFLDGCQGQKALVSDR
jgi:TetR/AcrR family transcriptional regulator, mexJK operon transcriptional repressor